MATIALDHMDTLATDDLIALRMKIDQVLASRAVAAGDELVTHSSIDPTPEDRKFVQKIFREDEPVFRALAK